MKISECKVGYELTKPPFGSDCVIEVLAERAAAKHIPLVHAAVKAHNDKVLDRVQINAWTQSDADKVFHQTYKSNKIEQRLLELEQNLHKKCRPSWWQSIFRTDEYRQKMAAKKVIEHSFELIKSNMQEKGNDTLFIIKPWAKDLQFRLNFSNPVQSKDSFIKSLTNEIKMGLDIQISKGLRCEFNQDEAAEPVSMKK